MFFSLYTLVSFKTNLSRTPLHMYINGVQRANFFYEKTLNDGIILQYFTLLFKTVITIPLRSCVFFLTVYILRIIASCYSSTIVWCLQTGFSLHLSFAKICTCKKTTTTTKNWSFKNVYNTLKGPKFSRTFLAMISACNCSCAGVYHVRLC